MLRWRLCKKTSAAFSSHSSSKEDKAIEQKLLYTKKTDGVSQICDNVRVQWLGWKNLSRIGWDHGGIEWDEKASVVHSNNNFY